LATHIKLKKEVAAPPLAPMGQLPPVVKDEGGEKSAQLPDKQGLIQRSRIKIEDINSQTQLKTQVVKDSTKES